MAAVIYFCAATTSGTIRVFEKFLSTSKDAERYLNREISFKEATDGIVNNMRIYVPLTTAKIICDVIVLSITGQWIYNVLIHVRQIFKGLINGGFELFKNGIKLSLEYFFMSLRNCSIGLILNQFNYLYNKPKKTVSSISIIDFCNICNNMYLLIGTTNDLKKTIQLELMKYWLECMGIIRAVAESHNINFVKYMKQSCSKEITSSSNNDCSLDALVLQWQRHKDPDFFRIINVSLEEINNGGKYDVIVGREIREIDKREAKIEEERYTITIEPGCPDGKEFRFPEAGHQDPVNIPADLIVKIQIKQHQLYERIGSDLIYKAKITLDDALRGTPIQVPLIDGNVTECNPHGVIKPDTTIIIDHAGLPDPINGRIRGRLIVKYDIEFPDTILGTEAVEQCVPDDNF